MKNKEPKRKYYLIPVSEELSFTALKEMGEAVVINNCKSAEHARKKVLEDGYKTVSVPDPTRPRQMFELFIVPRFADRYAWQGEKGVCRLISETFFKQYIDVRTATQATA